MSNLADICPVPEMPILNLKPASRMLRITIDVPAEDICWDSCTCERDAISTDRGDEPVHSVEIGLASYNGHFIEFSDEDAAIDYMIEENER